MSRESWNAYFMQMAEHVATRATCDRKHVGCVIHKDNRVLATGYNGSLAGTPHCDDVGHHMEDGHCIRTVHAEANAIAHAARAGVPLEGATLTCNTTPCWPCFKLIASAGIVKVVFKDRYRANDLVFSVAEQLGVEMVDYHASEGPYITEVTRERAHNPGYDPEALCVCGHPYYRHFDWMGGDPPGTRNDPVGCKYCGCDFTPKT